jgi:hypothetical protein
MEELAAESWPGHRHRNCQQCQLPVRGIAKTKAVDVEKAITARDVFVLASFDAVMLSAACWAFGSVGLISEGSLT